MDDDVRERLLTFVERTADFVGVCDGEGRVLYLNEAARKRLGVADAQGMTTADLFPPEAFARYYDEVRPALLVVETAATFVHTWKRKRPEEKKTVLT